MKKKIAMIICGILLVGSTIAYADGDFSETVEFGAIWNHGSDLWNISKSSYSDLGKWGYWKKARASINGNENTSIAGKDTEWACARQSGGWWNQLATAGYDIQLEAWK